MRLRLDTSGGFDFFYWFNKWIYAADESETLIFPKGLSAADFVGQYDPEGGLVLTPKMLSDHGDGTVELIIPVMDLQVNSEVSQLNFMSVYCFKYVNTTGEFTLYTNLKAYLEFDND